MKANPDHPSTERRINANSQWHNGPSNKKDPVLEVCEKIYDLSYNDMMILAAALRDIGGLPDSMITIATSLSDTSEAIITEAAK